jgi:hypothetical protein
MNPTWVLSLLSFVTGMLMTLPPRRLAAVSPSVGKRYPAIHCKYLAILDEFRSIQNQADTAHCLKDDPAPVRGSTFDVGRATRPGMPVHQTAIQMGGWPSNQVALKLLLTTSGPTLRWDGRAEEERIRQAGRGRHRRGSSRAPLDSALNKPAPISSFAA